MTLTTIGDGAQFLTSSRQNTALKTALNTLAAQLSSGEIADKTKALGGDTARFSAIDHSLTVLATKQERTAEMATYLSTMQRNLDALSGQGSALSEVLTKINADSTQVQVNDAARNAAASFANMVSTLNTQVAGKSLFSGVATDQPALAAPEAMIADLVTAIGGATDQTTILAAIDTWFDDPAGGFATMGYLGDTGAAPTRRLDENTVVSIEARADAPALRDALKAAAIAAVADELPGISQTTKTALLFQGGVALQTAAAGIVDVQANLGFVEGEVERTRISLSAEASALTIARNDIANADPFETASALQAVQLQLETHYQITARLSQLSLANYLR